MLRILAGSARGRALKASDSLHLRPILARIKKSIFDIITPRIPDSRFLDLYAGTGAVGIEALSRGAKHSTFVENDPRSLKLLNDNLAHIKFAEQASVFRLNVLGNLSSLQGPFDLIFMGPPYKDDEKKALNLTVPTLLNIEKHNLLKTSGLIIAQHHDKEILDLSQVKLVMVRQKEYGDTLVSFFKHNG